MVIMSANVNFKTSGRKWLWITGIGGCDTRSKDSRENHPLYPLTTPDEATWRWRREPVVTGNHFRMDWPPETRGLVWQSDISDSSNLFAVHSATWSVMRYAARDVLRVAGSLGMVVNLHSNVAI